MKKYLFVMAGFLIFSSLLSAETNEFKYYSTHINYGTMIAASSGSVLTPVIVNIGGEYFFHPVFSTIGELNLWVYSDVYLGVLAGLVVHPLSQKAFDPYLGLSLSSGLAFTSMIRTIDIPAFVGFNVFINKKKTFGIKINTKVYLLSLSYSILEIDVGVIMRL